MPEKLESVRLEKALYKKRVSKIEQDYVLRKLRKNISTVRLRKQFGETSATKGSRASAVVISGQQRHVPIPKLVRFIAAYAEVLGRGSTPNFTSFHPYEVEFAARLVESVILNDGEELTGLFSRQSGKSTTVALIVAAMIVVLPKLARVFPEDDRLQPFRKGFHVGIFAPVKDQAYTTYDKIRSSLDTEEADELLTELDISFSTNNGDTVALTNGSLARCQSASDNSHIEGKTYHLIICEECQEISNYKIRKSIHPMGASTNATLVKIGTPYIVKGDFYYAIERNKILFAKTGKKNHFQYDYKVAQEHNPRYKKYIQEEKWRLGEHSDEFRMSYKLEWILERGMFVTQEQIEEMMSVPYNFQTTNRLTRQVAAIDFGKTVDSTIITIMEVDYDNPVEVQEAENIYTTYSYVVYDKRIIHLTEIHGDDYERQYHMIMDILAKFNVERLFLDSTGVGDPMADRLMAYLPNIDVVPYHYTTASKSEGYKFLAQEIQAGRLKIPGSKEAQETMEHRRFLQQLSDLEKTYSGQYLVCQHPDMQEAHDDYPDSLMLACMASKEEGFTEIEVSSNSFYS